MLAQNGRTRIGNVAIVPEADDVMNSPSAKM